ncbi:hypothetical protein [Streptomyces sp. I05A-00742]|uniref:hypothetical protein n=1 Tax=Streptomyces sp. I05A-00742 TaxID=2732853 RepID=UPI001489B447|nr:hypothetical protein [Streptomyces sp. I05A-00742]
MASNCPWWHRKVGIFSSVVTALAVLGGAALYIYDAYDDRQYERSISDLCEGTLDHSELKELLGGGRLRPLLSSSTHCSVGASGSRKDYLSVDIKQRERVHDLLISQNKQNYRHPMVSPVGNGWAAFMTTSEGSSYADAYMSCGKATSEAIVVSAQLNGRPSAALNSEERTKLAGTAVGTLIKVAKKEGCGGKPRGNTITGVPRDSTKVLKQAGKAVGTCRGIDSPSYESAADDTTPIENCVLTDGSGKGKFRLTAYYGPYVQSARHDIGFPSPDRNHRATATCPSGDAFYVMDRLYDGSRPVPPEPALETQAMKTFAANSAKRHGCSVPSS